MSDLRLVSDMSKRAFGFRSPFDWLTDNRPSASINRKTE